LFVESKYKLKVFQQDFYNTCLKCFYINGKLSYSLSYIAKLDKYINKPNHEITLLCKNNKTSISVLDFDNSVNYFTSLIEESNNKNNIKVCK